MQSTRSLIIANWKMNVPALELKEFLDNITHEDTHCEVVICPPFTLIHLMSELCAHSYIKLGAQSCHFVEKGAFTGEISVPMLKDAGAEYVIVGHSERRSYFFETDDIVNKKLKFVLECGLVPILCVGETWAQRSNNKSLDVVMSQIEYAFRDLDVQSISRVVIAYEPIWAIGSGEAMTSIDADLMCKYIRSFISKSYSKDIGNTIRILYGGSLNSENIADFLKTDNINGGLIGGASLDSESFGKILHIANNLSK